MRLKARNKIQKYVPDNETLNQNNINNESYEEEFNHMDDNEYSTLSQKEENMLIFEIFVENLFSDLNNISRTNSVFKERMPNFKRHKEVMLDFIKTGNINEESKHFFGKSKLTSYQQAIFYTEDLITKLLKNLVRDSVDKFNGNYKHQQKYQEQEIFNELKQTNFNIHAIKKLGNYVECGKTASSTSTLSNKEFGSYDEDLAQTNESINENDLQDVDEDYVENIKTETTYQDIDGYDDNENDDYDHGESYDTIQNNNFTDQTQSDIMFSENDSTRVKEEDGSGPTGEFSCHLCSKMFNKRENLARHLRTHGNDKQLFECKFCNIRFTRKQNLKRHIKIHTGENMFSCSLCEKKFPRKDYLVTHLKHHSGEKPFSCSVCQKRFTHKNDLTRHEFIHTGQKTYECDECDKSFLEKSHLVRHLKTRKHLMKS